MKIDITVEELITLLTELGVDLKEENVKNTLLNHLISKANINDKDENDQRREFIKNTLLKENFKINLKGFEYLVRAIELKLDNPNIFLVKGIYQTIALEKLGNKEASTTIERSIRHLLINHAKEYTKNPKGYSDSFKIFYQANGGKSLHNNFIVSYFVNYVSANYNEFENNKTLIKK